MLRASGLCVGVRRTEPRSAQEELHGTENGDIQEKGPGKLLQVEGKEEADNSELQHLVE